jgi:hypothetical protein
MQTEDYTSRHFSYDAILLQTMPCLCGESNREVLKELARACDANLAELLHV